MLQVSVSGYYVWKHRLPSQRQLDDLTLLVHIRSHFALSNQTYGAPRMHAALQEEGLAVCRPTG